MGAGDTEIRRRLSRLPALGGSGKERAAPADRGQPPPGGSGAVARLVREEGTRALGTEAQVALALRTLGGLSTPEVARALMVPEATMAKRLTRAKQKIAQARI